MGKKPNYGFEKRRKEIERQRKKAEKLARKREAAEPGDPAPEQPEGQVPPAE